MRKKENRAMREQKRFFALDFVKAMVAPETNCNERVMALCVATRTIASRGVREELQGCILLLRSTNEKQMRDDGIVLRALYKKQCGDGIVMARIATPMTVGDSVIVACYNVAGDRVMRWEKHDVVYARMRWTGDPGEAEQRGYRRNERHVGQRPKKRGTWFHFKLSDH